MVLPSDHRIADEPRFREIVQTALDSANAGAITTKDTFDDDNNLVLRGVRIQNADRADHPYGHGPITAGDVRERRLPPAHPPGPPEARRPGLRR